MKGPPRRGARVSRSGGGGSLTVGRRVGFTLICLAYLATTTAEAVLSPIFPAAGPELGLGVADAGALFAVLAGSIAAGTLAGGLVLHRSRPERLAVVALVVTAAGAGGAAGARGPAGLVIAQAVIGIGAGSLWPAAVKLVGDLAGPDRRGRSMAIFGTAFSGGLVLAAALAAAATSIEWRWAFVVSAVVAMAAAGGMAVVARSSAPLAEPTDSRLLAGVGSALGGPTVVGVVAGVSQYATVSFLPVFAVDVWALSAAGAASVLVVARILSIPAKLVAGSLADRVGPEATVRLHGAALAGFGVAWALSPRVGLAIGGAVCFASIVSGLFPLANQLAFERSGGRGTALGVFRAVQIGAGALVGLVLGLGADRYGLQATIAVTAALPAVLVGMPPAVGRSMAVRGR